MVFFFFFFRGMGIGNGWMSPLDQVFIIEICGKKREDWFVFCSGQVCQLPLLPRPTGWGAIHVRYKINTCLIFL